MNSVLSRRSIKDLFSTLILLFLIPCFGQSVAVAQEKNETLKVAIAGLVHGHVDSFLDRTLSNSEIEVVGLFDLDPALLSSYANKYQVGQSERFTSLSEMLELTQPHLVIGFSNTFDHLEIVELAGPLGIDVILEKPLAVSLDHGTRMADIAAENNIKILVNYVSSWYASNNILYEYVKREELIGPIRKMVARFGHKGPKEIGVQDQFLSWLVDPALSGGGVLTDFACYGANLMTWLMGNERPISVTAITQSFKTDEIYSNVPDEATLLLEYPEAQGIIQASWNYPVTRTDIEVYGSTGYAFAINPSDLRFRMEEAVPEALVDGEEMPKPLNNIVDHLISIFKGETEIHPTLTLENNMIVTEILEAAKQSAESQTKVVL